MEMRSTSTVTIRKLIIIGSGFIEVKIVNYIGKDYEARDENIDIVVIDNKTLSK